MNTVTPRARVLWISLAIIVTLLAATAEIVHRYQEFQASIRRVHTNGGYWHKSDSFNHIQAKYFTDQQKRPVAYILLVYDDFDPNVPAIRHSYRYDRWRGGMLEVDGVPLRRSSAATLFVNGPFGATVRIDLDESEAKDLFERTSVDQLREFWNDFVEPRVYNARGETVAGLREGSWVYDLPTGERYLEGNFTNGQRDGSWTVFYPNGDVQVRKQFLNGLATAEWEFFREGGQSLGTLEFVPGHMKDIAKEHASGGSGGLTTRLVTDKSGKESGNTFLETDGGVFVLQGQRFPRYPWKNLVLSRP